MERDDSKSELQLLRLQLDLAKRDLEAVTSSRTWRMTAWIRWTSRRIKRNSAMRRVLRGRIGGRRRSGFTQLYRPSLDSFVNEQGEPEGRPEAEQPTVFIDSSHDVLVLVHVYYLDLWGDIERALGHLEPDSFDLVVTTPLEGVTDVEELVTRCFPAGVVLGYENHGRDIWPMLQALRLLDLSNYVAVLKLHTKRSLHRTDHRNWGRDLLRDLLPDRQSVQAIRGSFKSRRDLGLVVSPHGWGDANDWGPNLPLVDTMAARLGMPYVADDLVFPAGSMFWARPWILQRLLDTRLGPQDFLPEPIPLDGTMAHAVERLVGVIAIEGGTTVETVKEVVKATLPPSAGAKDTCRLGAFFLPQFHEIPENNEWWGHGYTEWKALDRAQAMFAGHQLLHPYPERRYDATNPEALEGISELMKRYGIDFIVPYFYWFDEKRLLEKPIDVLLRNAHIPIPFAYCWANEPWSRRWDGLDHDVLQALDLGAGWEQRLALAVSDAVQDERYVRIGGRPMFIIYRPDTLPEGRASVEKLRSAFNIVLSHDIFLMGVLPPASANGDLGFAQDLDGLIAFPPNSGIHLEDFNVADDASSRSFAGHVWHYPQSAKLSGTETFCGDGTPIFQGVMPSWDNSPRRHQKANIFFGANAIHFRRWLGRAMSLEEESHDIPLAFINAWNAWGEGTALEPSTLHGFGNLDAVRDCKNLFGRQGPLP